MNLMLDRIQEKVNEQKFTLYSEYGLSVAKAEAIRDRLKFTNVQEAQMHGDHCNSYLYVCANIPFLKSYHHWIMFTLYNITIINGENCGTKARNSMHGDVYWYPLHTNLYLSQEMMDVVNLKNNVILFLLFLGPTHSHA